MKTIVILATVLALSACDSTTSIEGTSPTEMITAGATDFYTVVNAAGDHVVITTEMSKNPDGSQSECWHWTHDNGTWYVRHCGLSLAEECFYWSSPDGQLNPC